MLFSSFLISKGLTLNWKALFMLQSTGLDYCIWTFVFTCVCIKLEDQMLLVSFRVSFILSFLEGFCLLMFSLLLFSFVLPRVHTKKDLSQILQSKFTEINYCDCYLSYLEVLLLIALKLPFHLFYLPKPSQYISYFSIQHLIESVLLSVTLPEYLVLSSAAAA